MDYLDEFKRKVFLYDSMLCETGGNFGRTGEKFYVDKCLEVGKQYILSGGNKEELLKVINQFIQEYEKAVEWKLFSLEMSFLNGLKEKVTLLKNESEV